MDGIGTGAQGFGSMDDHFDFPSHVSTFNFTTFTVFCLSFAVNLFHCHYCLKILSAWFMEPWEMG
jgi:hypothetical protein